MIQGIMPPAEEIEDLAEEGAEIAQEMARELKPEVDLTPCRPKFLRWRGIQQGILLQTDKSTVIIPANRVEDLGTMLRAMIDPRLVPAPPWNC